jgi:chromosomal replication initiation ATPase DnaA
MFYITFRTNNNNNNQATETRMLLLIGGSGHGKTKLLNVFVNYLYDVKLSDNLRYFISEDDDNAYTINV